MFVGNDCSDKSQKTFVAGIASVIPGCKVTKKARQNLYIGLLPQGFAGLVRSDRIFAVLGNAALAPLFVEGPYPQRGIGDCFFIGISTVSVVAVS